MPNRDFDTGTWSDPWFEELPPNDKLLFIYLWTNNHCTPCGMYHITTSRIANETGLQKKQVEGSISNLHPKVLYDPEHHLVFVRSFVRRQRRSGTFLVAISRALEKLRPHRFLLDFYEEYQTFPIDYIETIPNIPMDDMSGSGVLSLLRTKDFKANVKRETNSKTRYLDHVLLSADEHEKLVDRFTQERVDSMIEDLDNYIGAKGKKYVSHNKKLFMWAKKNGVGKESQGERIARQSEERRNAGN